MMKKMTLFATILAFIVVVLGAYTRLKDAGLGCPDWPGCYGQVIAPSTPDEIQSLEANWQQTVEPHKAWIEMIHRYAASTLGFIILCFALRALFKRVPNQPVFHPLILLCMVIFQGLLGMWTVTLKLYPVVVMAHLMGGLTILATLWWYHLRFQPASPLVINSKSLGFWASLGLMAVIAQLVLGGWVSANYAAVVCPDFPQCQGKFWPEMDFRAAFQFASVGIFDSPGVPLENTARVTIQMAHRLGALVVTGLVGILISLLLGQQTRSLKSIGRGLGGVLVLQLGLGITNVLAGLPLAVAVLHNAVAALLLLKLVKLNVILSRRHVVYERGF